ncbi:MAG: ATP-binding protein [Arcicella sp.]|nr:ATP-binding protein [Arcicella sp.]
MGNDLVGYSRAGDVFHYRWAARRSLQLIYPNTLLESITVEGSQEVEKAGELVIDVTETYLSDNGKQKIKYYQLKHTTVQGDIPFVLSDLKTTFEGFAKRYEQHAINGDLASKDVSFVAITNRKIADDFKRNIDLISHGKKVTKLFAKTIENYTGFTGLKLKEFCAAVILEDGEGNYNIQKEELRTELKQLFAGTFDDSPLERITNLIQEKVLPNSNGLIVKNDILRRFNFSSERDMYPAEPLWEHVDQTVKRLQHNELIKNILSASSPVIIHAEGGVGKSVFARQVLESLPQESVGIAYDCFGAGNYRDRSKTRHGHRIALVQIANELSAMGLCPPMLVQYNVPERDIMHSFMYRITTASEALLKANRSANLVLLIDAADNAEMAALEFNDSCFAHELIREQMPPGCKIAFLCRTERIQLLQPLNSNEKFELSGFNENESYENLKHYFPEASKQDGAEFHRLTNGNPRVQANSLDYKVTAIAELLRNLGPVGTTVEDQIELQLSRAVERIEDIYPNDFKAQVNSICTGLASLSPHIPIDVLAKAAQVENANVKSFVSDIGRPLWISDSTVQFRDEPTETWFRKKYCGTVSDFKAYVSSLEQLGQTSAYVALVLPQLYLQAEQYHKLISTALSDDFLPTDNPIDARNIRIYRLQFAFKAALKIKQFKDAVKIAIRAGEEMAGEQRQLILLRQNLDLLVLLQSNEKVKEIAFKRSLSGSWVGSENVYSASLLSSMEETRGEARGYLRAALYWLDVYFEESRKKKTSNHNDVKLEDGDVLELCFAQLNINGLESSVKFILKLNPASAVYNVIKSLTAKLIDIGDFAKIEKLAESVCEHPYYVIAITDELGKVGHAPSSTFLESCLKSLCLSKTRIKLGSRIHGDTLLPAILSFLEACVLRNLDSKRILKALNYYFPERANQMVYSSHFSTDREIFLRALAIRMLIYKNVDVIMDSIIPSNLINTEQKRRSDDDLKEFKYLVNGLLPWYQLRLKVIKSQTLNLPDSALETSKNSHQALQGRYRSSDSISSELNSIYISILKWSGNLPQIEVDQYFKEWTRNKDSFYAYHHFELLRSAYRLNHLTNYRKECEQNAFNLIKSITDDGPDQIAERYIAMARAILVDSIDDASVYFEYAIDIVSKFGDELYQRWEATTALAKETAKRDTNNSNIAFRYIRIAELVGENLREKHWDRGEAIQICTRMSNFAGMSSLSRWRERHVGRFEWLEAALLLELIDEKKISIEIAIAMTSFLNIGQICEFLLKCLHRKISKEDKLQLIDALMPILKNEGVSESYWKSIKTACDISKITNKELDEVISFYTANKIEKQLEEEASLTVDISTGFNWKEIFLDLDLNTKEAMTLARANFKKRNKKAKLHMPKREFWKEMILKISENSAFQFLDTVLQVEDLNLYDIEEIFEVIPDSWKKRVSFKRNFAKLIRKLGQKFAYELVIPYYKNSLESKLDLNKDQLLILQEGIFETLSSGNEFANSEMLFGFVVTTCPYLAIDEATDLLEFAISRFELHIDEEFAEGSYDDMNVDNDDLNNVLAGFIYSSLGSPESEIRWKAAHCVKKLIEGKCIGVVDELFWWLKHDSIDSFGIKRYPFYNLHAKLYLFIAFSRAAINNPLAFLKEKDVVIHYALNVKHILIQKFAGDIALTMKNYNPDLFTDEQTNALQQILKSKYPVKKVDYNFQTNSYLHARGEVNREIDYLFGYDFDSYWFQPLGEVFGVPIKQVEDLAANVISSWGVVERGGYNQDPRVNLWNSSNDRSTWYSKSEYPTTDRYDFYLSYHSMMVVAADLLENMPILERREYRDDEWNDWLSRHLLTRSDGMWLSDFRDPVPLNRPSWLDRDYSGKAQLEIQEDEFLNSLIEQVNGEPWLNVKGSWHENSSSVTGTYHVTSALVLTSTSESLLNALSTCDDFRDFKLPNYEERRVEIKTGKFELKGWINERDSSRGIDEFDPYAAEIYYPPYSIGKKIREALSLNVSDDGKTWYLKTFPSPSLITILYANYSKSQDDEPAQKGIKMMGSLAFLKLLCTQLQCELIIEVQIGRNTYRRYRMDDEKYRESLNKIFILSSDGKIRESGKSYQLG